MDVAIWLRSLGLSRYEAAFSDNSIDADVLLDLTDGDLLQLGVNLGDRKRLLKAIASLGSTEPAKPAAVATQSLSKSPAVDGVVKGANRPFDALQDPPSERQEALESGRRLKASVAPGGVNRGQLETSASGGPRDFPSEALGPLPALSRYPGSGIRY